MRIENYTHVRGCETDLVNDTGAPTISPEKKIMVTIIFNENILLN